MFSNDDTVPERLYATDPDRCCDLLKVGPTRRAIEELGVDCWVTGLRCTEGRTRTDYQETEERDVGLVKLNPILIWHEREVWQYLALHHVPVNLLYAKGYRSLGCAPCSRITNGGDERPGVGSAPASAAASAGFIPGRCGRTDGRPQNSIPSLWESWREGTWRDRFEAGAVSLCESARSPGGSTVAGGLSPAGGRAVHAAGEGAAGPADAPRVAGTCPTGRPLHAGVSAPRDHPARRGIARNPPRGRAGGAAGDRPSRLERRGHRRRQRAQYRRLPVQRPLPVYVGRWRVGPRPRRGGGIVAVAGGPAEEVQNQRFRLPQGVRPAVDQRPGAGGQSGRQFPRRPGRLAGPGAGAGRVGL